MTKAVCIQGLGFVGAAMAVAVAGVRGRNGRPLYQVIGLDLPTIQGEARVSAINRGVFPFPSEDESLAKGAARASEVGNLRATTDEAVLAEADVIIVDVHLDVAMVDEKATADFDNFSAAVRTIGSFASPGTLIIVETTVPPGTCENVILPILQEECAKRGLEQDAFYVAHSYERVMPGPDYLASITNYWRVFAGSNEQAAERCREFLSSVINVDEFPLTQLESTTASETAKILENTYRAVNIALIDEWTKFAEKMGINLHEVIQAIAIRPTHCNIRFPGLGVGGYCLTKDPLFGSASILLFSSQEQDFPFAKLALDINRRMPIHAVERIKKITEQVSTAPARVLVCGVSYRPDVSDTRYSPSETLVEELSSLGLEIVCHDPYVEFWEELQLKVNKDMPRSRDFDIVILAVGHRLYRNFRFDQWASSRNHFLDANNVLSPETISDLREAGIPIHSIGRGGRL